MVPWAAVLTVLTYPAQLPEFRFVTAYPTPSFFSSEATWAELSAGECACELVGEVVVGLAWTPAASENPTNAVVKTIADESNRITAAVAGRVGCMPPPRDFNLYGNLPAPYSRASLADCNFRRDDPSGQNP